LRVRLESLGCRLNIGEIEAMARQLADRGCEVVGPGEPADLCIFNSCTVTSNASRKSRQMLRRLRRSHPGAVLVATGCDTEIDPESADRLAVSLVVGNRDKDRLLDLLESRGVLAPASSGEDRCPAAANVGTARRTRAFVKVQDGCDNRCAFCIVTVARGSSRSRPVDQVVAEVRHLVDRGFREVVLSGVHLGSYGHDIGDRRGLEALVRRVLSGTAAPRLRLSSLEPWDLDARFFELFDDPRLLPHLHLPLQSGSDRVLRSMGRRSNRGEFADLVAAARAAVPDVSISTDVMAGFPGETDGDFSKTVDFVETMAFSRLHVFTFSRRAGTPAAVMPGQVPGPVAAERSRALLRLGARLESDFNRRFIGSVLPVLWESSEPLGPERRWSGLTDNYIRVIANTDSNVDLTNRVTATRMVSTIPGGLAGVIDHSDSPPSA
jgi:threonylcarbamoyladenosine tRNA methylthiotransferase MtaB